jgi:hypothetical protein
MMRGGSEDQSILLQEFVELTGVDTTEAFERIYKASGDIRVALDKYFFNAFPFKQLFI